MIRVLIAIQEPVVGIGLQGVIEASDSCECVGVVQSDDEVQDAVVEMDPNVLLLDVLFRRAAPELVPELARRNPRTCVLMYVDHSPLSARCVTSWPRGSEPVCHPRPWPTWTTAA